MTRSSQPMAGVSAKKNDEDINLLEQYRLAGRSHHQPQELEGPAGSAGSARLAMSTVKVNAGAHTHQHIPMSTLILTPYKRM